MWGDNITNSQIKQIIQRDIDSILSIIKNSLKVTYNVSIVEGFCMDDDVSELRLFNKIYFYDKAKQIHSVWEEKKCLNYENVLWLTGW